MTINAHASIKPVTPANSRKLLRLFMD